MGSIRKMGFQEREYEDILQRLEECGSYEISASPRDISKLSGIRHLLSDLGEPHRAFRIVHIAGSAGKGLTGAMLAAVLRQEGWQSGCYSSPHVVDIRERIALNGRWIPKESFAQGARKVFAQVEAYDRQIYLSYFDILTAIAFLAFQEANTQWVVLETGLGGKADSTNVTEKELCILTRIGFDHVNVLGETLEAIAEEKLGIVRKGIPTVLAVQQEELRPWLIKRLEQRQSPMIDAGAMSIERKKNGGYRFQWPDQKSVCCNLRCQQETLPYLECLKTVLIAAHALFPASTGEQRRGWVHAAAAIKLPGRLEYCENVKGLHENSCFSRIIFDGGHNAAALQALADQLKRWRMENYVLVLGFAKDKLINPLKEALKQLCERASRIIATRAQSPRAASPEELSDFLLSTWEGSPRFPSIELQPTVEKTLERLHARQEDPIVVCGSFYLLGEFFRILGLGKEF